VADELGQHALKVASAEDEHPVQAFSAGRPNESLRVSVRQRRAHRRLDDQSAAYLCHHLARVGREEPLFADDAISRLHRVSNGLPRALNNAAMAALIVAAADGKDIVDDACAKKAAAEVTRR
jgi:hypothetical protein